jgi:uncharacterized membrane protein YebE (DUF533 family)
LITLAAAADAAGAGGSSNAPLALLLMIAAVAGWFAARAVFRRLGAGRTEAVVRGNFEDFAREALVNAAKIDGRVAPQERTAIAAALGEIAGAAPDAAAIDASFAKARLSKGELIAYLRVRSHAFSREQKMALLKALLSVFVADGVFDESEHAALVDYTEAIGFDRQGALETLRGLSQRLARGNII